MNPAEEAYSNTFMPERTYFLVIEHIKSLIRQGLITFGGKLPSERQLMSTLGLSRNSVREALRTMENMGIIESRQGQGNFLINHITESLESTFSLLLTMNECSYLEISQLRRSIEIGAYLLVVKQTTETNLHSLKQILDQMEKGRVEERALLDKHFHDTLIDLSGNRLLKLLSETLSGLVENTIQDLLFHVSSEEWTCLLALHTRIYACLLTRDEKAGIAAVMEHYDFIDRYNLS